SVVYWPPRTETDGPFALMEDVLEAATGDENRQERTWHLGLAEAARTAGLTVDRDEPVRHEIDHPGPAEFWKAMTVDGPMRRMMRSAGEEFADSVRAEFLREAPEGPWRHRPAAGFLEGHRA
ncbi:MAG TPA: methyltransferase type 11, partial [Phytomonospora sp.]